VDEIEFQRSSKGFQAEACIAPVSERMFLTPTHLVQPVVLQPGRSGRTGPLDYLAPVGMKAVKAVGGACWRCRILGKKVGSDYGSGTETS
jgi:hypothetical protein